MTTDDVIDGILQREGPGTPPYLEPGDHGGRTAYGIAERSHPEAWRRGPPTREEARAIYARVYVEPFAVMTKLDPRVRVALVDDAVLSGVSTAIRTLQAAVGVLADGVIGPATVKAVWGVDAQWLLVRLVRARAHRLARIVEQDHDEARFIVGWIDRTLSLLS